MLSIDLEEQSVDDDTTTRRCFLRGERAAE
jgi:hypothetical protein